MDVYMLIREDQNDHGFVDTSIAGVYATREGAMNAMKEEQEEARAEGWRVATADADGYEGADWQVYWKIEEQELIQ